MYLRYVTLPNIYLLPISLKLTNQCIPYSKKLEPYMAHVHLARTKLTALQTLICEANIPFDGCL